MMTPEGTRTAFDVWVAEREKLCDQANWFWRDGGLNKTKIYKACGLSGYQPFNSYLKPRFDEIEKDWIAPWPAAPQKAAPKLVKAVSQARPQRRSQREETGGSGTAHQGARRA